ncbi:MAG: hypothetical protein JW861_04550, partial [Bacteroidales bacterium]|nr:hypothetical protein [Bacteroidales bacterium]
MHNILFEFQQIIIILRIILCIIDILPGKFPDHIQVLPESDQCETAKISFCSPEKDQFDKTFGLFIIRNSHPPQEGGVGFKVPYPDTAMPDTCDHNLMLDDIFVFLRSLFFFTTGILMLFDFACLIGPPVVGQADRQKQNLTD